MTEFNVLLQDLVDMGTDGDWIESNAHHLLAMESMTTSEAVEYLENLDSPEA